MFLRAHNLRYCDGNWLRMVLQLNLDTVYSITPLNPTSVVFCAATRLSKIQSWSFSRSIFGNFFKFSVLSETIREIYSEISVCRWVTPPYRVLFIHRQSCTSKSRILALCRSQPVWRARPSTRQQPGWDSLTRFSDGKCFCGVLCVRNVLLG